MSSSFPWLTALIVVPILGAVAVWALPAHRTRAVALGVALLELVLGVAALTAFDVADAGTVQLTEVHGWIPAFGVSYAVGVDGVGLSLVLMSVLIVPLVVLAAWREQGSLTVATENLRRYLALVLLLEAFIVAVFSARDVFLFYVLFEAMLIPVYFMIGMFGGALRRFAAVKFLLYSLAGGLIMLVAVIALYLQGPGGSEGFLTANLTGLDIAPTTEKLLFLAFFLAFAIKVPLFPVHTWLPDAHVEAPTAGSIMLASVMLKMGTYGILHFCLPLFPSAARTCAPWIVVLAIIGIVYGALVAMVQPNMKKLVAYSSVSHLGFVVLGIFTFTQMGLDGATYQMLNHGISTGALFAIVGLLYERRHSLEIDDFGGVATVAPWLSTAFLVTTLASIGLPMLNNFVGEFLVLQGAAMANFQWAIYASLGVILSACYMLWMYQRVFYGEANHEVQSHVPDLNVREWAVVIPLIAMMVWMGVYSQSFLPQVGKVNARIIEQTNINVPFKVGLTTPSQTEVANAR